jgi:hypothetical protein
LTLEWAPATSARSTRNEGRDTNDARSARSASRRDCKAPRIVFVDLEDVSLAQTLGLAPVNTRSSRSDLRNANDARPARSQSRLVWPDSTTASGHQLFLEAKVARVVLVDVKDVSGIELSNIEDVASVELVNVGKEVPSGQGATGFVVVLWRGKSDD